MTRPSSGHGRTNESAGARRSRRRSTHHPTSEPQAAHKTLTSEREVSAYLHRARMSILAALHTRPATVSQIAATIGVHPANLTRHIRILEAAKLIALVEKRDTGRNLEKYYQAAARSFDVAPDAHALRAPHKIALALARSQLSAAIERLPDASPGAVKVLTLGARLTPKGAHAFQKALARLAAQFEAADVDAGVRYQLTLAMYPDQDEDLQRDGRVVLSRKADT